MRCGFAILSCFLASPLLFNTACIDDSPTAQSTPPGNIEGVVRLKDAGVAAGVEVRLSRVETESCMFCGISTPRYRDVAATDADEQGRFSFPSIREGYYAVFTGEYEGFRQHDAPTTFRVFGDATSSITVVLVPIDS